MSSAAPKGNLGEWSELYTLGFLLVNGGAYAADENQERQRNTFYRALEVIIASRDFEPKLIYKLREQDIEIYSDQTLEKTIPKSVIEESLNRFFRELTQERHPSTFNLKSGEEFLTLLSKKSISASSNETENDLEIILQDYETKVPSPAVGFSIKSQLGGAATLLNASGATNFIYKILREEPANQAAYPEFEHGRHKKNLKALYEAGFKLKFHKLQRETFNRNLQLLDSNMTEYLANIVLGYYLSDEDYLAKLVEQTYPASDSTSRQPIFKVKEFLGAISMGMRPSLEWDGDTTKFRGIIVVKSDGDVIFYYLYNRKSFEEYLFKSVRLERASTSRHGYGAIYSEDGNDFIKLNLQIRFNK
jgi:hypothetical protein